MNIGRLRHEESDYKKNFWLWSSFYKICRWADLYWKCATLL